MTKMRQSTKAKTVKPKIQAATWKKQSQQELQAQEKKTKINPSTIPLMIKAKQINSPEEYGMTNLPMTTKGQPNQSCSQPEIGSGQIIFWYR